MNSNESALRAAALLLFLAACSAPDRPREEPQDVAAPEVNAVAEDASGALPTGEAVVSNGGSYRVVFRAVPGTIPMGELFALEAWVLDPDGTRVLDGVDLAVDAGMPHHRHGMNTVPSVAATDDGGFEATGMLFHMPGAWTITFDVTEGPLTERAQAVVEIE